jgi:tetratricopeptide (TPR) repeat protein
MAKKPSPPGDARPASSPSRPAAAALLAAYRWPLVAAAASVLGACIGAYWFFFHETRPEPAVLLARALECLDRDDGPDAIPEARRIASELDALKFRDPAFPGALSYILGIVEFRRARELKDRDRIESFRSAAAHLAQAENGIDDAHRFSNDFALGIARYASGDVAGAEAPLLRVIEASLARHEERPSEEFLEAAATLQEGCLDRRDPAHVRKAIELNDLVLKLPNVERAERDRTLLRRAQMAVLLHDADQAQRSLDQVSKDTGLEKESAVIRAQVDIIERRFDKVHEELEPLANEMGLDSLYPRQALFLLGVCYEAETQFENALRKYADAVRRYPDTPEGLAANVRRAELLRRGQRWEEALDSYVRALELIRPSGFANRWLQFDDFRSLVLAAWNDLIKTREYEFAVELARHMRPLFPPRQEYEALERVATANQLWALQVEAEIADKPYTVREERQAERLERWRHSGKAHAELAEAMRESPRYGELLWTSAEHYRKAHDFQNALVQITRFVNTQPRTKLALPYVRRGEILVDLGRFDEAMDHFERVLGEFAADVAAFQAMYLVGVVAVERNEPQRAIAAWQHVVQETRLEPSAGEWQASLFSLGRLQFQMAMTMRADPASSEQGTPANPTSADAAASEAMFRPLAAYTRLDDAIRRLDEYVARYPDSPDAAEARFLLAKSLRERAELPRHKLRRAETDNARKELLAEIQGLFAGAQKHLDKLIESLQGKESGGLLDPFTQRMLRDSYFERAHNLYVLQDYERAIEAYTSAANRYPEDPSVFLAYIQMANCYDRLNKPFDARGAAIQAMLIHKNMPETAFSADKTLMNRDDWRTWLEWVSSLRQSQPLRELAPPPAFSSPTPAGPAA